MIGRGHHFSIPYDQRCVTVCVNLLLLELGSVPFHTAIPVVFGLPGITTQPKTLFRLPDVFSDAVFGFIA